MTRATLIWGAIALVILVALGAAAQSPLLAWRSLIYIAAGFAGVVGLALLLLQPLLTADVLPGAEGRRGRRLHAWIGASLLLAVLIHVAGLWIESPPDVVDALLFRSPTPFSAYGVIAMWAVFAAGLLAALRRRLRLRPKLWRKMHVTLAVVIVSGTVVHAVQIEGTMEVYSKLALCGAVIAASLTLLLRLRFGVR